MELAGMGFTGDDTVATADTAVEVDAGDAVNDGARRSWQRLTQVPQPLHNDGSTSAQ